MRLIDVRAGRFEQAVIVVVLLAGFTFRQPWSIPIAACLAALGTVLGERSPLARLWSDLIARRLAAARTFEAVASARLQILLITATLAVATGLLILDAVTLASIVAGLVAIIAALAATGIVSLAAELRRRAGKQRGR